MNIIVPDDIGGKLRVLPEGPYNIKAQDIFLGESKAGNAKATLKWVVTTEYEGKQKKDYIPTTGENVLESFSLLPNAIWNLNDLFKDVTKESLPKGEFSDEEFEQLLKENLIGAEFRADLVTDTGSGEERTNVDKRVFIG